MKTVQRNGKSVRKMGIINFLQRDIKLRQSAIHNPQSLKRVPFMNEAVHRAAEFIKFLFVVNHFGAA